MLTEERRQYILKELNEKSTITLQNLTDTLNVSTSTIRRDLSQLEKENKLTRVHGGAKRNIALDIEQSISEKTLKNIHAKNNIAQYAASRVQEGDVIYLDAGTSTYAMIPYLAEKNITVVTNGIQHAESLTERNIDTYLIGGNIKASTKAVIGALALNQLRQYRFSNVFLGINGVDSEYGLTTPDIEEAVLKQTAMELGNHVYFLADSSKFNKVTFCQVAETKDQFIITDSLQKSVRKQFTSETRITEVVQ